MKPLTLRQKLLLGVLTLTAGTWALDTINRGGTPRQAAAAQEGAPGSAAPPETAALSVRELAEHLLSGAPQARLAPDEPQRNLFEMTAEMSAALAPAPPPPPVVDRREDDRPDTPEAPKLQGVITGRVPLAILDGRLCPLGSEVDGWRVVEILRDRVLLRRTAEAVWVAVPPPK